MSHEYQSLTHELRHVLDVAAQDARNDGAVHPETAAFIDRLNHKLDTYELDLERKAASAYGYNGPMFDPREADPHYSPDAAGELKAFNTVLRTSRENYHLLDSGVRSQIKIAGISEVKDLQLSDDAAGGFLAPSQFVSELIRDLVQVSPIRQYCRNMTVSARSIVMPTKGGGPEAYWVRELGSRTSTGHADYGLEEIPTHEAYAESHISEQLLEDAVIDIQQEIRRDFADRLGILEAAAFLSGDGVGKPFGILANSEVLSDYTITASTTGGANQPPQHTFLGDDLLKLVYELPDPYADGARFFLHRRTVGFVRALKDLNGQYIWQPGLANDAPPTIAGLPYSTLTNMSAIGIGDSPSSSGAYPIIVGDLRRAYLVIDRVPMVVKRLNELYAASGMVGFIGRRRVGGQVILPEAIRVLVTT